MLGRTHWLHMRDTQSRVNVLTPITEELVTISSSDSADPMSQIMSSETFSFFPAAMLFSVQILQQTFSFHGGKMATSNSGFKYCQTKNPRSEGSKLESNVLDITEPINVITL